MASETHDAADANAGIAGANAAGAGAGADFDVAIVGYGPVGSTLAVLLGQLGRSVVVLERWPSPYPLPRAVHFDDEVGRILQSCGIGLELRRMTDPVDVYEWRNGTGTPLLRFARTGASASGWPLSSMFHQPSLEALLDRRIGALPSVTIRRGVDVVDLEQDERGVTLRAGDGSSVRAAYAVGCDGANSTVRALMDPPVQDLGFSSDWLVVDVLLHDDRVFDPPNLQVCDPDRPTTVVSGGPGRRRWEFMRLPDEPTEQLGDEKYAWKLLAGWDVHPGNARLERHAVYTFRARHAESWRAGRVLLAGDAAHLMPPFAGQGLCAGIRDVANLAWKLDLVVRGRAPTALLATYEEERLPTVRTAIDFSMELGKVICVLDPAEADARDEVMSAGVGSGSSDLPAQPGIDRGLVHPDAPFAGELFVQGTDHGRLFDDVHGAGWRLVTLADAPLSPDIRGWFSSIGGRVVPTGPGQPVHAAWFTARSVACALQRPDFHLYGTAAATDGAEALLAHLRSRLHAEGGAGGEASPDTPKQDSGA